MRLRPRVTGIGLITPIGADPTSFWEALASGRSGAGTVSSFETGDLPNHVGCEVAELSLPGEIDRQLSGGRCTRLAAFAVGQAVAQAGLDGLIRDSHDTAIVVGTTMGEVTRFERLRAEHPDDEPDITDIASLVDRPLDVMARSIARLYGLTGPLLTAPAACAAGAYAVGLAATLVARGEAVRAIAVGCEAFSRLAFVGFTRMRAMSPDSCRPFSLNRRGLLLGEGAGAVVIEAESAAEKRGAECLGYVDGFGLSCDAHHVTAPHPEGAGAIRAMQAAISRAGLESSQIDYVNAHGTGTALNDQAESLAVQTLFGERTTDIPVSSIKALTGHMMGGSGAVEVIASLLAIEHATIPPTWNWEGPDPRCAIDCVPNEPRKQALAHVLSNSYAFGGNNASLVLTSPEA